MATDTARIAGWVLRVSWRSASGPSKQSRDSGSPSAASAAAKACRASACASAQAFPIPTRCEPWPGKTKASRFTRRSPDPLAAEQARLLGVQLGDLVADLVGQIGGAELDRPAHRVLDRARRRAAVADEAAAAHSEQRRGAVFRVVDAPPQAVEGRPGHHVPQLGAPGA